MAGFTQTNRIWWSTDAPGSSTSQLYDADEPTLPPSDDHDSGVTGRLTGEKWEQCERSGFVFPTSQMTDDPNTGRRVGIRFVDPLDVNTEADGISFSTQGSPSLMDGE